MHTVLTDDGRCHGPLALIWVRASGAGGAFSNRDAIKAFLKYKKGHGCPTRTVINQSKSPSAFIQVRHRAAVAPYPAVQFLLFKTGQKVSPPARALPVL